MNFNLTNAVPLIDKPVIDPIAEPAEAFWKQIPADVWCKILSYTLPRDISSLRRVNKNLQEVFTVPKMIGGHFANYSVKELRMSWQQVILEIKKCAEDAAIRNQNFVLRLNLNDCHDITNANLLELSTINNLELEGLNLSRCSKINLFSLRTFLGTPPVKNLKYLKITKPRYAPPLFKDWFQLSYPYIAITF